MSQSKIAVLKFGGSVLTDVPACTKAVHEIYRYVRNGYQVAAVVSALYGETDRLMAEAETLTGSKSSAFLPALLGTGEERAASLIAMAAEKVGLKAHIAHPFPLQLRLEGPKFDAVPVDLDLDYLKDILERHDVVVVPGFVGIDKNNHYAEMGRGGTDLTAIFLGQRLDASVCRLLKDVDGVFERDPNATSAPLKRYVSIHWDEATSVADVLVQPKSVAIAKDRNFSFEVAGLGRGFATRVGSCMPVLEAYHETAPLRVGILGFGTVGAGVYQHLAALPKFFTVEKVIARSPDKKRDISPPREKFSTDPAAVFDTAIDLLIECMPGVEPALELVTMALENGIDVITANKALVAQHGEALWQITERTGASLAFSAAVGGGAPILETVKRVSQNHKVSRVEAVLNGTCNFILDQVAAGQTFDAALQKAQEAGFAEADPSMDIEGWDAAYKIQIIAKLAYGHMPDLENVPVTGITGLDEATIQDAAAQGKIIKLVATCSVEDGEVCLDVQPVTLTRDHYLAGASNETCRAVITSEDGAAVYVSGKGAGRWPTSEAVMADVLDAYRRRVSLQKMAFQQAS